MIKKVRKRDNPMIIWFAGICCVPRACLRRERTTTIRVNEVNITSIAGARESIVKRNNSCRTTATLPGSSPPSPAFKLIEGMENDCPHEEPAKKMSPKTTRMHIRHFPNLDGQWLSFER
jgi:hypothetical protein